MRIAGRVSCFVVAWWAMGSLISLAQTHPTPQVAKKVSHPPTPPAQKQLSPTLLSADQGLAVLGAALESRHRAAEGSSDCSHVVHAIYEKAGFPYRYQRSSDLYVGASEFLRVTRPQPGDLIVWPGHAGIVVNPAQHTFYSSLRSGFGVEPYDSDYWKSRGRPRFFRYVKATKPTPVLAATNRTAARPPSLKPAGLRSGHAVDAPTEHVVADVSPVTSEEKLGTAELEVAAPSPSVIVKSARPRPDQLIAALNEHLRVASEALQPRNILTMQPVPVAFDRFEVKKVQLRGDSGWAQIHIHGAVAVAGPALRAKKGEQTKWWSLRRRKAEEWEMVVPPDATYLSRESAVRLLAHQLAAATDSPTSDGSNNNQKVQLTHWLNLLIVEPASH